MSLAPSPFADVHVPVRIFIHPFSVIRWRFFIVFRWINWVILFIREIITAVTAHPPISEPAFAASTTVTWGTAFTTPTEMTLTNHAHTRPHLDKARLSSNLFFFSELRVLRRSYVLWWELSRSSRCVKSLQMHRDYHTIDSDAAVPKGVKARVSCMNALKTKSRNKCINYWRDKHMHAIWRWVSNCLHSKCRPFGSDN